MRYKIILAITCCQVFFGCAKVNILDRVRSDFKEFTYISTRKFQTTIELPPNVLEEFKNILPTDRYTPLLSEDEWIQSLKKEGMERSSNDSRESRFISQEFKMPRIFKSAYGYKNYFIIDYYFTGRYRLERRAVIFWVNNQIEAVLIIRKDDLVEPDNIKKLKRYKNNIYVGNLTVDSHVW